MRLSPPRGKRASAPASCAAGGLRMQAEVGDARARPGGCSSGARSSTPRACPSCPAPPRARPGGGCASGSGVWLSKNLEYIGHPWYSDHSRSPMSVAPRCATNASNGMSTSRAPTTMLMPSNSPVRGRCRHARWTRASARRCRRDPPGTGTGRPDGGLRRPPGVQKARGTHVGARRTMPPPSSSAWSMAAAVR